MVVFLVVEFRGVSVLGSVDWPPVGGPDAGIERLLPGGPGGGGEHGLEEDPRSGVDSGSPFSLS